MINQTQATEQVLAPMPLTEFSTQFYSFESALMAFAVKLTNDIEDAHDLYQETAYKAFKNRGMYRPKTNLKAWLVTIMKNIFINNYRKKKRRQILNDPTNNNYYINSGSKQVANQGQSNITMEELTNIIGTLEDNLKVPFLMHYRGFKYDEIADELGLPLGTIKSRIFFARKKLKAAIKERFGSLEINEILD